MAGYVGVPSSYTPVEYIESSGTQYIDTGFKMSNTTKIETRLSMTANNIMTAVGVGGSYQSFSIQTYNSNYRVRWRSGTTSNIQVDSTIPAVLTTPHVIEANSTNAKIDGTVIGNTNSYQFTETSNLFIFAMSSNNTAINNAIGRIYYYKIYNGSTLVRDFIPVIDQDNVACLYEQVEGNLYYNQGTGSFTAGSTTGSTVTVGDKARKIAKAYVGIPNSYTPVEYIESSGTQYIDTEITQNGYHSIIDVSFSNFSNLQIITGTYGPMDNQRYYTRINTNGSLVTQFGGSSGNNLITGPTLTANTRYIINTKLFNGAQNLTVNGTSYGSQTIAGQTFPQANIYLLAIWSDVGAGNNATCKLYGAKYYDSNNTLTRDFIPAVDQDNVACLYEQVEGKLYYNKGTGSFVAGQSTGQPVVLNSVAREILKGYVGVNGVARLAYKGTKSAWEQFIDLCKANKDTAQDQTLRGVINGILANQATIENKMSQAGYDINSYTSVFAHSDDGNNYVVRFITGTGFNYYFGYGISGYTYQIGFEGLQNSQYISSNNWNASSMSYSIVYKSYYLIGVAIKPQGYGSVGNNILQVNT